MASYIRIGKADSTQTLKDKGSRNMIKEKPSKSSKIICRGLTEVCYKSPENLIKLERLSDIKGKTLWGHTSIYHENTIIVFGGQYGPNKTQRRNCILIYDIATDKWNFRAAHG